MMLHIPERTDEFLNFLPETRKKFKGIYLDNRDIDISAPNLFEGFENVVHITINDYCGKSVSDDLFAHLPKLKTVSIGYYDFTEIPETLFEKCPELTEVQFIEGELKVLPEGLFRKNPKLTCVYFQDQYLKAIPEGLFEHNPNLEDWSFDQNPIEVPHPIMFDKSRGILTSDRHYVLGVIEDRVFAGCQNFSTPQEAYNHWKGRSHHQSLADHTQHRGRIFAKALKEHYGTKITDDEEN